MKDTATKRTSDTRASVTTDAMGFHCPLPQRRYAEIQMAHGGGGTQTSELIERTILPQLPGPSQPQYHDGAVLAIEPGRKLCFTTDSFVVRPLFFPGGDIGQLAVFGTVNDLAMCGGEPRVLSLAFILEEGFSAELFDRVMRSIGESANACGVEVVTGDTKVVERGKGDGVYINTTGIGVVADGVEIAPGRVREGDVAILTAPIGRHGMAVMSCREGLVFDSEIQSDSAPLHRAVKAVLDRYPGVRCLRDPTRGGLATALCEIAAVSQTGFRIRETDVLVPEDVRAACEILGLDPLYVANEGACVLICDPQDASGILQILETHTETQAARIIGRAEVTPSHCVLLETPFGAERLVDPLSGEQLPRIC